MLYMCCLTTNEQNRQFTIFIYVFLHHQISQGDKRNRRIRVASLPNQENRQLKMAVDMKMAAVKENKRLKLCVEVLFHHDSSEIDS